MDIPEDVLALLRAPSTCYLATTMPDGSPQLTQVWVDTDGEHVVINTVAGFQKLRNVARDPRVAVAVSDPANPSAYVQIRGEVVETTTDGAREHIVPTRTAVTPLRVAPEPAGVGPELSQKYLGRPYPGFGGNSMERVIVRIAPRRISGQR